MLTDITQYMDFAVLLFFAFGLAFEIPVATVLLVRTGLVKRETLAKNRGYVLLAIFIIAAFLTPPDPVSQTLDGAADVRALRAGPRYVATAGARKGAGHGARSRLMLHRNMAETRATPARVRNA